MTSLYESLAEQVNSLHAQSDTPSEYPNELMESCRMGPYHQQIAGMNSMTLQPAAPQLSSHWTRYSVSEFVGSFIATIIVDYTYYNLSGESQSSQSGLSLSGFLFLALGIGAAYFFGVLIAVEANLNATFTFGTHSMYHALCVIIALIHCQFHFLSNTSALAICWAKPWRMVPIILLSQFIGATVAHLMFYFMIGSPEPLDDAVAFCFGISPPPDDLTNGRIIMSSIVFITILMMALLPVFSPELGGDANRSHLTSSLIIGLIIAAVAIPGSSAGAQMHPTGFFSAFMAMAILGFDEEHFSVHRHYWWTAFVGPFVGVIVALTVLTFFNVAQWSEPRDWKVALQKMTAPPTDSP